MASDYLRDVIEKLVAELFKLHAAGELTFGVFGAEITLYRVPRSIDVARMLANRGLLLEVLPILRLCLEMIAWANVAFSLGDEDKIVALKAQGCISQLKQIYETAGKIYGYLSRFAHWGQVVHGEFISSDEEKVAVIHASARYRAMTLALCLVIIDVLVEAVRAIYGERSKSLILAVQDCEKPTSERMTFKMLAAIVEKTRLGEILEIQSLLICKP